MSNASYALSQRPRWWSASGSRSPSSSSATHPRTASAPADIAARLLAIQLRGTRLSASVVRIRPSSARRSASQASARSIAARRAFPASAHRAGRTASTTCSMKGRRSAIDRASAALPSKQLLAKSITQRSSQAIWRPTISRWEARAARQAGSRWTSSLTGIATAHRTGVDGLIRCGNPPFGNSGQGIPPLRSPNERLPCIEPPNVARPPSTRLGPLSSYEDLRRQNKLRRARPPPSMPTAWMQKPLRQAGGYRAQQEWEHGADFFRTICRWAAKLFRSPPGQASLRRRSAVQRRQRLQSGLRMPSPSPRLNLGPSSIARSICRPPLRLHGLAAANWPSVLVKLGSCGSWHHLSTTAGESQSNVKRWEQSRSKARARARP